MLYASCLFSISVTFRFNFSKYHRQIFWSIFTHHVCMYSRFLKLHTAFVLSEYKLKAVSGRSLWNVFWHLRVQAILH